MDASTARTANIRRLVADAGGPAEWVRLYGGTRWVQSQVSQWISWTNPKGIGKNLARDLEAAMGLPHGVLDSVSPNASHPVGLDDATLDQAVQLLYLMADARPEDKALQRPTWAMIRIAAKAITKAEGDQRGAMAEILAGISKET